MAEEHKKPPEILPEVLPEVLPEILPEMILADDPALSAPAAPAPAGPEEIPEIPEMEFSPQDLAAPAGVASGLLDMGDTPLDLPQDPAQALSQIEPADLPLTGQEPPELEFSPEFFQPTVDSEIDFGAVPQDAPPRPSAKSDPSGPVVPGLVLPEVFELEQETGGPGPAVLDTLHRADLEAAPQPEPLPGPAAPPPASQPEPQFSPRPAPQPEPQFSPRPAPAREDPPLRPSPEPEDLDPALSRPAIDAAAPGFGFSPPSPPPPPSPATPATPAAPPASPGPAQMRPEPPTPAPPGPAPPQVPSEAAPAPGLGLPDFPDQEPAPVEEKPAVPALPEGWTAAPVPDYPDFVLEWGLGTFLFTGASVRKVTDITTHPRHLLYLVDYYHSPGPGVLTIDGPPKYAPVLGRKKLQEQGELTEEFSLHIMESHKVSDSQTSLAYQLLPTTAHQALMNLSDRTSQGYLLYDSTAAAYGFAMNMKSAGGDMVALHLPSCVVAVAVKGEKIVFAHRYILSGDDEAALRFGLSSLHQDAQGLKRQGLADLKQIHWIEALTATPTWPKADYDIPFERLPLIALDVDGETQWSALPELMGRLDPRACLGPRDEIRLLPLEGLEKWIWASLAVVAPALVAGTLLLYSRSGELTQRTADLQRDNVVLRQTLAAETAKIADQGQNSLDPAAAKQVAERIRTAGAAPTMARLWNDLARAKPSGLSIASLNVNYAPGAVNLRLLGNMDQGVAESQAVFSDFLTRLNKAGFTVSQQTLALDGQANSFAIELTRPVGE